MHYIEDYYMRAQKGERAVNLAAGHKTGLERGNSIF